MAEVLELSDWEFETAMINRLKILIQKMDNTQEEMGHIHREMETLRTKRKAWKKKWRKKPEMKMPLMDSAKSWAQLRKKSMILKCQ